MERRAKSQARSENVIGAASSPQWNPIGPQPVANEIATFGGTPVGAALASATGRITSIAIDPTTQGRLFIGTAAGGVWMSVDGGATFTPIFDAQPTLAIGALALDPATNPPTIYAGTGEANNSGDSHYGLGVFVSSDLGNSWTQQTNGGAFLDVSFARIAIDTSQSPPSLFGAASIGSSSDRAGDSLLEGNMFDNGLWRSTDGANTWSHIPLPTQAGCPGYLGNCPADDVAIDPVSPTHMYASIYQYGVVTSTDGGDSWQMINFPGIANTAIGRASVAALNGRVYVALGSADGVEYRGFFNSTDQGNSWTAEQMPAATVGGIFFDGTTFGNFSQADFDQALVIDPSDSSGATVLFGGVGIYRSVNSGASWTFLGQNGGVASDQHAIAMDPFNPGSFFAGNDGGAYSFNLGSSAWTALNATLPAMQFQSIGPNPGNSSLVLGGADYNGTILFDTSQPGAQPWNAVDIGDGGFAIFDRVDPAFAYHDAATGSGGAVSISRSLDGGMTWSAVSSAALQAAMSAAGDAGAGFFPPLASDPLTAQRVFFGAHSVYVSTDAMQSWAQQTTQDLTGGCTNGACAIQDLEFAQSANNVAYALSTQTFETNAATGFKIFQTSQANLQVDGSHPNGGAWNDLTINLPFNASQTQPTGLAVNPFNAAIVYLTLSGFSAATGVGHVFVSIDSGAHWFREDGNSGNLIPPPSTAIPDVPVLRLLVDGNDRSGNTLLAGTDIGVFQSTNGGQDWAPFNLGVIPAVPVFDIEQNLEGAIFAATHGRGAYQLSESDAGPIPTPTAQPTAVSVSPTATSTPVQTATPTISMTPTATPVASLTATQTAVATPTVISTTASTPTATLTATPTATGTPLSSSLSLVGVQRRFGPMMFGNSGATSRPLAVSVVNRSFNAVTMTGQSFSGGASSDFHLVAPGTTCASELAARSRCNYMLVFRPTALGVREATVLLSSNAANSPQIANLSGLGLEPPIVILPRALSFGRVAVNTASLKSFTITNRNTVALTITAVTSNSTDFLPGSSCVGILNAGASCTANVAFDPVAGALKRIGVIQIFDNAARSPQSVRVSGIVE